MASIELNSEVFVNGETIPDTEEIGKKKIKLSNVGVTGDVVIANTTTPYTTFKWVKDGPDLSQATLTGNIDFTSENVILDKANPPAIVTEENPVTGEKSYYATFGVIAEGNVAYDGKDYMAHNEDLIRIKLEIDDLKNPEFVSDKVPPFDVFFNGGKNAYIGMTDKLPKYMFTFKGFSLPVKGQADVYVDLVTPKQVEP